MPVNIKALGLYLQQQLTEYDPNFYDVPEDELWGTLGLYVPATGDLPFGVEEIDTYRRKFIGEASISDGVSMDIPLADVGIDGSKAKAILVMSGVQWSMAQVERAKLANSSALGVTVNLAEAKLEALNVSINRRIHRLVYAGEPAIGFNGMFNSSVVNPISAVGDGNLYGVSSPLTPAQLTTWFQGYIASFKISSRLPYSSIVAYVDDSLYTALCQPIGDNTGDTPYMRLTSSERGRFVADIIPITELNPTTLAAIGVVSSASTRGRILMGDYRNVRSVKRRFLTIDRTDPFMKDTGVHFGVTGWSATSETMYLVPERFTFIDFAHS